MNKSLKQNWFESPLIINNLIFFHEQKSELLSFGKQYMNDRPHLLTPNHNSKPIEIQKNRQSPFNQQLNSTSHQSNKFDDINLPSMFSNAKIQKVMIQKKIDFQDSSVIQEEQDYQTPQRFQNQKDSNFIMNKNTQPDTTAKKSTSNFSYCQQKKSRPKQKGLRILSQKAYEIILRLSGATYKQVATILVKELEHQDCIDINGKDQQNIKRRVYDALNVLIALGVLKKEGRKIFGVPKDQDSLKQFKAKKQKIQQQIVQKKCLINDKIAVLQSLKKNKQSIKALIKRNKYLKILKQKIDFPFIAVAVKNLKQDDIQHSDNKVLINALQKKLKPFGDVDSIQFLRNTLKPFIQ